MKRPLRFRPALERLEDRWCPSYTVSFNGGPYMPIPSPGGSNAVGGALGVIDNDPSANLSFKYQGGGTWKITDTGTTPTPDTTFTGVTGTLSVTMGGTQDTLVIDGSVDTLGLGHGPPNNIAVALDGTAPAGMPNSFTFKNIDLNNANNPANSTLSVLGQGANNNVAIGDGIHFTRAVIASILYRDATNGSNPGTLNNGVNSTTMGTLWLNGLYYTSKGQSSSPTDLITMGSGSAFVFDYGDAKFDFGPNSNNPFSLSLGGSGSFVGSANLPNAQFTVLGGGTSAGGGSSPTVTLGDGGALTVQTATTVIDLDDRSGGQNGTINVNAGVMLKSGSIERFDDYGTINIDPNGGTVTLAKPLTIWNSDGGSNVTLGGTAGGTISGDVTFDTGVIFADSDDSGSPAGAADNLVLASGETLAGNLTANLNASTDSVDVEGNITKNLTVKGTSGAQTVQVGQTAAVTIGGTASVTLGNSDGDSVAIGSSGTAGTGATINGTGTSTIAVGSGNFDTITVGAPAGSSATFSGNTNINLGNGTLDTMTINKTALFKKQLAIALGGGGAKTLYFDGTVGPAGSTAINMSVTSAAGAVVSATLDQDTTVNGSVSLSLSNSASNDVDYKDNVAGAGITQTLFAVGHTAADSVLHRHGHATGTGGGKVSATNFTLDPP